MISEAFHDFVLSFWLALILGMILSIPLHEFLHWLSARFFTRDLGFAMDGTQPNVQFHSPYDVPKWGVRIIGATPAVVGIILAVITLMTQPLMENPTSWSVFWAVLGVVTALGTLPSGGDWLAMLAPAEFQKFAADSTYEVPRMREMISIIRG